MFRAAKEFKVGMFSSDMGEWGMYDVSCLPNVTWAFENYDNLVAQKETSRILAVSVNGTHGNDECWLIA